MTVNNLEKLHGHRPNLPGNGEKKTDAVSVEKKEGKQMKEQMTAIPTKEYDVIQQLLDELDYWYEWRTADDDYGRKTYTDDGLMSRDVFLMSTYGWLLDAYNEAEKQTPKSMTQMPTSEYEALQPVLDALGAWYEASVTVSDENVTYKNMDVLAGMHVSLIEQCSEFLDSRKKAGDNDRMA